VLRIRCWIDLHGSAAIGVGDERGAGAKFSIAKIDRLGGTSRSAWLERGSGSRASGRGTGVGEPLAHDARGQSQEHTGSETHLELGCWLLKSK
jgi:hypothetical protein